MKAKIHHFDRPDAVFGAKLLLVLLLGSLLATSSLGCPDEHAALVETSLQRNLRLSKHGNESARNLFFQELRELIFPVLQSAVSDVHLAEDLTQDTLLRFHHIYPTLDPRAVEILAVKIALGKLSEHRRQVKALKSGGQRLVPLDSIQEPVAPPQLSELEIANRHSELMRRARKVLTNEEMAVFVLGELDYQPTSTVAAILATDIRTVQRRLRSAREKLQLPSVEVPYRNTAPRTE